MVNGLTNNYSSSFSNFNYNNLNPVVIAKPQIKSQDSYTKTAVVWGISLIAVAAALLLSAKKGILGERMKNFIGKFSSKKTLPKAKVSDFCQTELSIPERVKALEKLKKMPGVRAEELRIDENGKITPLLLQNLDFAKTKMYDSIRCAKYPQLGDRTIAEFTDKATSAIKVSHNIQNGDWDYRTPVKLVTKMKTKERISLNVRPEKDLIEKLDKYLSEHVQELQGYYKTPGYFEGWSQRHDPITIYFPKKVNNVVLEDIAKIAEPYAREDGSSVLLGKRFGTCCAHMREAQKSDFEFLRDRFLKIFGKENASPKFQPYGIRIGRNPNLSAGEFCAYNEVFNKITGENIRVLIP